MSTAATDNWVSDQERAQLLGASDTIRDALGVQVSTPQLVALEKSERERVRALCRMLRETPERQVPSPDQRVAAEAFADGVSRLPTSSKALRREQVLLAEYVREVGFVPSAAERLVFRGVSPDATLDDLRADLARVAPEARSRFNWAELADGEAGELETIIEKALGEPGYFAERRSESGSRLRVGLLARRAEDGAAGRARLPEGWLPLPPTLLDDVHRGEVWPIDLAVLTTVALTLQTRRVDPARERHVRFDGDTLLIDDGGRRLLRDWDPQARGPGDLVISAGFSGIAERLSRAGWIELETPGQARPGQTLRVRLGRRFTDERGD